MMLKTYAAFLAIGLVVSNGAAGSFEYRTVALTGEPAPGIGSGVEFSVLFAPCMSAGQTAFAAYLTGPGIDTSNNRSAWFESNGEASLVVRGGDLAPGGGVFAGIGVPLINSVGDLAFGATLASSGAGGFWSWHNGTLVLNAREGMEAPGAPAGVLFKDVFTLAQNDAGQVMFGAHLEGSNVTFANDEGIWAGGPGSVGLIVRAGDVAPTGVAGVRFAGSGLVTSGGLDWALTADFNNSGRVAFRATVTGPGISGSNSSGLWLAHEGSLTLLVQGGDAAPGTDVDVSFSSFNRFLLRLNDSDHIAFVATLAGPGMSTSNNQGIWLRGESGLMLVARAGGSAMGRRYGDFAVVELNDADDVAFVAGNLSGTDASDSIWRFRDGELQLITYEGAPVPNMPAGTTFRGLPGSILLNDHGEVAFKATIYDGVDFRFGLWLADVAGELHLAVLEGDSLDADDDPMVDDFRIVRDMVAGAVDEPGELAFRATFDDGTAGAFVARLLPLCELDGSSAEVNVLDLLAYLTLWFADDETADLDGAPGVGVFDLLVYLDCWFHQD